MDNATGIAGKVFRRWEIAGVLLCIAAGTLACSAAMPWLGSAPQASHEGNAKSCAEQIKALVAGLIDAGYRITSRYDPTPLRPGAITAKAPSPGLEGLSVHFACDPELDYEVAGSGVLGLTGTGRTRAEAAIRARLAGQVAKFAREVPSDEAVRVWPTGASDALRAAGIRTLDVEIRNHTAQRLLVHPGATVLITSEGVALSSMDAASVAGRLALRTGHLDRQTTDALAERRLPPTWLAPHESVRGLLYFEDTPAERIVIRALTDDLREILLSGVTPKQGPGAKH